MELRMETKGGDESLLDKAKNFVMNNKIIVFIFPFSQRYHYTKK